MAEIMIVAAIAAVCVAAVVMYVKKLRQGCCGASSDKEREVASSDADISSYSVKYIIEVGGMTCPKCAQRIQNGFNRQEGCYALVSHKDNRAEVYVKKEIPELLLRKTIVDLGYTAGDVDRKMLDIM